MAEIEPIVGNITQILTRKHNDLQNRDAAGAHPASAITGLTTITNLLDIPTRNHNDLQNLNAANAHPASAVTGLVTDLAAKASKSDINLLAAITPSMSGWSTNPSTTAQITDENYNQGLTAAGVTGDVDNNVIYDLGSEKRIAIQGYYYGYDGNPNLNILISHDNVNWYQISKYTGLEAFVSGIAKCRYIKFKIHVIALLNKIQSKTITIGGNGKGEYDIDLGVLDDDYYGPVFPYDITITNVKSVITKVLAGAGASAATPLLKAGSTTLATGPTFINTDTDAVATVEGWTLGASLDVSAGTPLKVASGVTTVYTTGQLIVSVGYVIKE